MPCRHCGRAKVNRPRGLCWPCYYTPSVRRRYDSTSKFGFRYDDDADDEMGAGLTGPDEPIAAAPGTEGKIAALAARARKRQGLWHPKDYCDPLT